jgi:hypothetical protein
MGRFPPQTDILLSSFAEVDEFERTFNLTEALVDSDAAGTATPMLLDIHLGGIAGIELRRCLAAVGSNSSVIFMTAWASAAVGVCGGGSSDGGPGAGSRRFARRRGSRAAPSSANRDYY